MDRILSAARIRAVFLFALAYALLFTPCVLAETVVFGSDHDYPPFEYLDEHGRPAGFNIDLIRAIAAAAGFEVEVRLGPWHEIRRALEVTGEIHIADMFYSTQRAELVDFATPYTLVHDEVFVHQSRPDVCRFRHLSDARVIVQRGSYIEDYLRSHDTGALLSTVDSEPEALRLLSDGGFDCAIVGGIVGQYSIDRLKLNRVVSTGRPILPREYGFVVAKGNTDLLQRINTGLRTVKSTGEYNRLYNQWFGIGRGISLADATKRYAGWVVVPTALLILGITLHNVLLSRRISARTADLRNELAQRTRAENSLRESEQLFRQLADNIDEVMWIADPDDHAILYISPAYETIWARTCDSLYEAPLSFLDAIHPDDRSRVITSLESQVDGDYNEEYRVIRPDGSIRWVTDRGYPIADDTGKVYRVVGIARDITERKLAEARIEHLATRDPLTDLPNRYLLDDRLEQGLIHAQRNEELLAVLFIDLDNFKTINDSLGHSIGDKMLQQVGRRISQCLREEDTLSRLGGDEFVVLIKSLPRAREVAPIADKILIAVAEPYQIEGHTLTTACSIGVSIFPVDGCDAGTLMRNADTAMYHAKSSGRHNFQFFSREMNERAVERLTLEGDLRRAIERNELKLYYQAKVDMNTGRIVGAEALLRWQHPKRGLLQPKVFIPIAEETGLIKAIGELVITQTLQQISDWRARGTTLCVAINLSARQLRPALIEKITATLQSLALPGRCFELEITESVLMEHVQDNILILQQLHALGINIAIDDFGTGYSSLSYLKRFPIHALKIDQSFVQDIESDSGSLAIVKAVISLARSLRLNVVAEGVETHNQLSALRTMEVDEYQGFLFNQPEPVEAFEQRLGLTETAADNID